MAEMADENAVPGGGIVSVFDDLPGGRATFVQIDATGIATAFNGHVDLGTGIETALSQIVAEELDQPLDRVRMILGNTASTPDQGATIASETIQVTAVPLRAAAAQLRHFLLGRAALRLGAPIEELEVEAGVIRWRNHVLAFGEVVEGCDVAMRLDRTAPLKNPADYRIVGQPVGRRDLPAKVRGEFTYIHDLVVADMLHGHVVRPPYAGRDSGDFVGRSLIAFDEDSVAGMTGLVAVVREGDFLGVVAETSHQARAIAEVLRTQWHMPPELPDMGDLPSSLKNAPSTPRVLDTTGDFGPAFERCGIRLERRYVWPYHLHGSIGPSCAVADWNDGSPVVWSGTQNPHALRGDLAVLTDLPDSRIEIRRLQAAGCYGRNCADDVCGDALLLSRAVRRPVRVQLTREQEHLWEPKGAGQLMEVSGGVGSDGDIGAYAIDTWYPSNRGPNLALLLTGRVSPEPRPSDMGDRTIIPPYRIPNKRITVHDMAPIVRAAWMRGVSALPNTFAHESFVDELAFEAGEDPVAFRLRHLDDPRQADLVRRTAEAGGWTERSGPRLRRDGRMAYGQGFAFATYVHGTFPGSAAASAAWVCDVAVDTETGEVSLTRVFVGQDQGLVINPDGVRAQIHGNVIQTASRALREQLSFDAITPIAKTWANYPIQTFDEVPRIETMMIARPDLPALGVGESAAVPAAAAIANAIFDATGVRLREAPFTAEKLRREMERVHGAHALIGEGSRAMAGPAPRGFLRRLLDRPLAAASGLVGALTLSALALPIHRAIPPAPAPAASSFSAELIERGRQVFAVGDCAVCHTAEGGIPNAGGRALETPFGPIYSTNLTPDRETGLGNWSFEAFDRAMRRGISRDGKNLYAAFPYTAFSKITPDDMFALYAYMQTLTPVRTETPVSRLLAPVNLRPVNAVWNLLYLDSKPLAVDPTKSEAWNRGRYLVEGAGHCSACHSPRDLLGAEKTGRSAYAGALIDNWWAPALAGAEPSKRGWSEDSLFTYLRTGHAPGLAVASGPMGEVVESLTGLPDGDIRAMATYLASLATPAPLRPSLPPAATQPLADPGARIFRSACSSCHEPGLAGAVTAAQVPLAMSAAIRAPMPDGLRTIIHNGIEAPHSLNLRDMPGFAGQLSQDEIQNLLHFLRSRYAPDLPAWRRDR